MEEGASTLNVKQAATRGGTPLESFRWQTVK